MRYTKQTWANGDIITAEKLNHMEDGISGSGALIVHMDEETGALDKTWAEINAAAPMVYYHFTNGSSNDFPSYNPLFACYESEGEYSAVFLNIVANTAVDYLYFITDSENGYPAFD